MRISRLARSFATQTMYEAVHGAFASVPPAEVVQTSVTTLAEWARVTAPCIGVKPRIVASIPADGYGNRWVEITTETSQRVVSVELDGERIAAVSVDFGECGSSNAARDVLIGIDRRERSWGASSIPAYNLDVWVVGEEQCRSMSVREALDLLDEGCEDTAEASAVEPVDSAEIDLELEEAPEVDLNDTGASES